MSIGPELRCRLCGGSDLTRLIHLRQAPRSVERLLREAEIDADSPVALEVLTCGGCGFVQLADPMPSGFYDDYEMAVSFSPRFQAYLDELCDTFVAMSGDERGRLLEVGCGDGVFLDRLRGRGFDVVGMEPSRRFRTHAEARGLHVVSDYLDAEHPAPGGPYDAVVARQVLEHVFDPAGFVRALVNALKPGGAGLIEVPSLEQAVDHGRYYDFFPDHVNYFSATTLARLCAAGGLAVVEVRRTFAGEFLAAFVRRPFAPDLAPFAAAAAESMESLRNFLVAEQAAERRVAVWGGGGKGVAALASGGAGCVAYVVDTDPRKQGLYLPASHIPVYPPEHLSTDPVDTVLITALAHYDEIIDDLVRRLAFSGTIASLGRQVRIDRA